MASEAQESVNSSFLAVTNISKQNFTGIDDKEQISNTGFLTFFCLAL